MIYLHIGVHKTATTYLQHLLGANQGRIAAIGRAYWKLFQTRALLQELQTPRNWTESGVEYLKNDTSSPLFRIREFAEAGADCVISDENMIGAPLHVLQGGFYPHAARRLPRIQKVLADKEIEVWLSLRAYDEFLPSIYCEALRAGHFRPSQDFVEHYSKLPDERWPAFVDAVHESFPDSRLVIWAYEDFRSLLPQIASRLSGLPYDGLRQLPDELLLSSSSEAIRQHCVTAKSKTPTQRILSMAVYEETYPRTEFPEKFYPWDPDVAAHMKAAYREDLAEIAERPYVEMLKP